MCFGYFSTCEHRFDASSSSVADVFQCVNMLIKERDVAGECFNRFFEGMGVGIIQQVIAFNMCFKCLNMPVLKEMH